MSINHCLLLSAGLGTRMGKIGKKLPKALWPIFNKKMIELEISFAKSLGCKDIFINSHFLYEQLKDFIDELNDPQITLLHEKELLGSGGAIHNLLKHLGDRKGKSLLTINSDQFFIFNQDLVKEALVQLKKCHAVFFGLKANKDAHYNELVCEEGFLKSIEPNTKKNRDYITYSGMGLINLEKIEYVPGESTFFESVANYKRDDVFVINPDEFEYWDFGTLELYHKNIFLLAEKKDSNFFTLCKDWGLEQEPSFFDLSRKIINLSNGQTSEGVPSNSVVFEDLWQRIK